MDAPKIYRYIHLFQDKSVVEIDVDLSGPNVKVSSPENRKYHEKLNPIEYYLWQFYSLADVMNRLSDEQIDNLAAEGKKLF